MSKSTQPKIQELQEILLHHSFGLGVVGHLTSYFNMEIVMDGVKEDMQRHGVTDGDSGLEQCPVTPRDQSLGSTASATATSNSEWLKCSGSL